MIECFVDILYSKTLRLAVSGEYRMYDIMGTIETFV